MKYEENDKTELKREMVDDIQKQIIAFLNTNGGTIYVGVDDESRLFPVRDEKKRDDMDTKVGNWIENCFYPDTASFIHHYFNEDDVMVIEVKQGSNKPYYLKKKGPRSSGVFKRVGRSIRSATDEEILSMILSGKDFSYESEISDEQDLSFRRFEQIFENDHLPHSKRQFRSLGLIDKDGSYTNLALLMSDQSPIEVKFASYDERMNFKVKSTYKGSLIKVLEDVLEHASRYNDVSATVDRKTYKRIEKYSYPGDSLREAILNAFAHADYFIRSNIKIEFFTDKVKISNPGGIYRASLDDILNGIQTYRNPGLVQILDKLGYIENFGTGIPKILHAYEGQKKKPQFTPSENFFILTLPNANDPVNDQANDQVNDSVNAYSGKALSDFDLLLLKTVAFHPGYRVPQLLSFMVKEDETVTADRIKNALKRDLKDYIEFRGAAKNGGYHLK
ncbi:MAG: putative DNA binding domain-containing protein [Erysipelotrichaceae bacterium]|nr:putative DNA binding domain-containing protein [Erysipelotrichaceae bacterium]